MNPQARILAFMAGVLSMVPVASADEDRENDYLWKPRLSSVTVFKNGLGFFLRQGSATLREGWCVSGALPPAAFGTLAIFSQVKGETVDTIGVGPGEVVEFDGLDAPKGGEAKRVRLQSCKYLKMQITYRKEGLDQMAAGQLVSVGPEYVVLQTEGNSYAVPLEGIRKLQILENSVRAHVISEGGRSPEKTTLGMAYLRKGITWIPEYTLTLVDEETAELTLRGTLVNEAEDIIHGNVNFVVGVPHFLHTEYMAPAAVGQILRTIGSAVVPREMMTQIMNRAGIASDVGADRHGLVERPAPGGGRDPQAAAGNPPRWEEAGSGDFTVYARKDMTLRTGEKAIVTLFVKRFKYEHQYRWSPPAGIEHFLYLHNDTDTPWTTGPCLVVSGDNALSEDMLKYVPVGGKGEFPVTTAINIANDQQEKEADRKLNAHTVGRDFFVDLVTMEGELKLRNFGKNPVNLTVEARVQGQPLTASDEGKVVLETASPKLLERTGRVTWRLSLKPGEAKTLVYKYERYVPSR